MQINLSKTHKILIAVFSLIASAGGAYATMAAWWPNYAYAEDVAELQQITTQHTQQIAELQAMRGDIQTMQKGFDDYRYQEKKRNLMARIEEINNKISELTMELQIEQDTQKAQLLRNKIQFFVTKRSNVQLELDNL